MIFERDRRLISTTSTSHANIGSRRLLLRDIKYKYCGKITGRWMFRLAKFVIISVIFGYGLWAFLHRPQVVIDENYGESADNVNGDIIQLESVCSQTSPTCYSVVDIVNKEKSTVHRAMYINGFEKEYDTVVQLIPPAGMSIETSDTRMWAINHTAITTQYVAAMLTQLFATAALPLTDTDDANRELLVIGLGGGNFDMFLHTKRPKIKISISELEPVVVYLAQRWFGSVDDEIRLTHIKDGLTIIKEARERGNKYDAVILDACDNTKDMPCPAKSFLLSQALINVKSILKPMGTFIVNVLPLENQQTNTEMVLKTLLTYFPVCIRMQMSYEANVVISCLPYSIAADNLDDTKKLILQRAEKASFDLGIHDVLEYLDLSVVIQG